jgi:hypothetical protein
VRSALAAEPTLAAGLRPEAVAPLLAPLVQPPLTPAQASGVDLILEGFLAHHGTPRELLPGDRDALVLAGDYCYAAGLVRVATSGDLFVIRALAELVALSAGLVAAGRRAELPALWLATVAAIAVPRSDAGAAAFDRAVAAARAGERTPLEALAAGVHHPPDLEAVFA